MKYLIIPLLVAAGALIALDQSKKTAKYYEDIFKDLRVCTSCPQTHGPGMSIFREYGNKGDTVIIFEYGQPVLYTDSTSTYHPLIAGNIAVSDYALYRGKRVKLKSVSMDGKAVIWLEDNSHKVVDYYDLQPYK